MHSTASVEVNVSQANSRDEGSDENDVMLFMFVHQANASLLLEALLGPRRQELYKVIPITIVYLLIFITGVVGNVCTCLVIARNRYMQTTTNCYLFNLAVSDLLVLLLGLPQETYSFWSAYPWVFGETFCLVRILAAETSTYASILTITAFTAERYVAICHPMRAQTLSGLQRAVRVIALIWLVSGVCSVPMVIQFGVVLQEIGGEVLPDSAQCIIRPERYIEHSFQISTFLFFFTPMTVITVLYVLIGLAVRRSTLVRTSSETSLTLHVQGQGLPPPPPPTVTSVTKVLARSTSVGSTGDKRHHLSGTQLRALQQVHARRAVLKMLVAVVVVFFLCWAPFHAQRLLVIYVTRDQWTPELLSLQNGLYYVSGILYYVSSVVNPILYSIMSLKFRQAFRSIFRPPCTRRPQDDRVSLSLRRLNRGQGHVKTFRFSPRSPPPLAIIGCNSNSKMAACSLQKQLQQQLTSRSPLSPTTPQDAGVLAGSADSTNSVTSKTRGQLVTPVVGDRGLTSNYNSNNNNGRHLATNKCGEGRERDRESRTRQLGTCVSDDGNAIEALLLELQALSSQCCLETHHLSSNSYQLSSTRPVKVSHLGHCSRPYHSYA